MKRAALPAMVVLAALATATVNGGGWGVITVKHLPDFVVAGRPVPLTFAVRGHGTTLVPGVRGSVEAVSGPDRVSSVITAAPQEVGVYHSSITLPRAGNWTISINAGYRVSLLPVQAIAPGAQPPALSAQERGKRLFVAKGCVTCHDGSLSSRDVPPQQVTGIRVSVGPVLVPHKYQPEFLARMLADPAANIPPRPGSPVRMPNLQLETQEIASLVAFINSGTTTIAWR